MLASGADITEVPKLFRLASIAMTRDVEVHLIDRLDRMR
jgi:hypothetical protein